MNEKLKQRENEILDKQNLKVQVESRFAKNFQNSQIIAGDHYRFLIKYSEKRQESSSSKKGVHKEDKRS